MATMTKTATRVTAPKPFNLPSRRAEGGSGPELNSAALRDGALRPWPVAPAWLPRVRLARLVCSALSNFP